ncbi:MAG: superoxide dismutase [Acetobacteraceae bacterium]|nr:superoxide dismutase [Acetobacteraceae bacterium]
MHVTRRLALGLGAALLVPAVPRAQQAPAGPFTLPPLPYAFDANEAAIDARTMEIHWRFHHGAQVNNLNAAVAQHSQVAAMPLDQILMRLSEMPDSVRTAIRNNGGGHANHSMFWQIMGGRGGDPSGELAEAIARDFGSLAAFREQFERASNTLFGSGWAFVTVSREGRLAIVQKPNQDNPLMDGQRVLMGNDVWEHAYYLRYQNRRAEYVRNWWNVLDWERIAARYAAAKAGTLGV